MKKIILFVTTLLLLLPGLTGCGETITPMPDDFNFTLSYGRSGLNVFDTRESTFTRNLVEEIVSIPISIPSDVMQGFFNTFLENGISELPENITTGEPFPGSPTFILAYTYNEQTKTITCHYALFPPIRDGMTDYQIRFFSFIEIIQAYIFSTDEYKSLPPALGCS